MTKSKNNNTPKPIPDLKMKELQLIGQTIRELRFNSGQLTQKELAKQCGVHFNTIQTIESGNKNYNLLCLLKIISYFHYDLTTFIKALD